MLRIHIRGDVAVSNAQDMHKGCCGCLQCSRYASGVLWVSPMLKICSKGAMELGMLKLCIEMI